MSSQPSESTAPVTARPSQMASLKSWGEPIGWTGKDDHLNTAVDCGWGRLIFGQTFDDPADLAAMLQQEQNGQRDISLYVRDPHLVLATAPLALFLDPSHTLRRWFEAPLPKLSSDGPHIRRARPEDLPRINAIFAARGLIAWADGYIAMAEKRPELVILVAEEKATGEVVGIVQGVDHVAAFKDPDNGSSLWALAVAPTARRPGIGRGLSLALAHHFREADRAFMDLSVMHDNEDAIALYQALGFEKVPVYCLKKKNTVNERLFVGREADDGLNVYAQIIVDEARRRGITADIEDAQAGLFRLTLGARTIACRESLSELTSAVAMSRCDDKSLTHRLLSGAGLMVPAQEHVTTVEEALAFFAIHARVVIKPVRGEQGQGVFVDLQSAASIRQAFNAAKNFCDDIVIEQCVQGQDVRIVVIDGKVVAAALRKPASILGDGKHSIRELIEKQSRRRQAATKGESRIPIDSETERCVRHADHDLDTVLEDGAFLVVRKTPNLHTGGTIHDATPELHPALDAAARQAANVLGMPVVGLDLIVPAINQPAYWIIEANERPGLANHEPAPTVERFVDFLFPSTRYSHGQMN